MGWGRWIGNSNNAQRSNDTRGWGDHYRAHHTGVLAEPSMNRALYRAQAPLVVLGLDLNKPAVHGDADRLLEVLLTHCIVDKAVEVVDCYPTISADVGNYLGYVFRLIYYADRLEDADH